MKIIGLAGPDAVCPVLDVTVYRVISLPPFEDGRLKLTFTPALSVFALTAAGARGTVAGVTLFDASEGGPVPILFIAATVNVQGSPLVRPFTVRGLAGPTAVRPVLDVTTYEMISLPPFDAGYLKLTFTLALSASAFMITGASGTEAGVTLFDAFEGGPVPILFVAATVNV